jgi:hypothetical protein
MTSAGVPSVRRGDQVAAGVRKAPNEQVTIGLACNGVFATVDNPITDCTNKDGKRGERDI